MEVIIFGRYYACDCSRAMFDEELYYCRENARIDEYTVVGEYIDYGEGSSEHPKFHELLCGHRREHEKMTVLDIVIYGKGYIAIGKAVESE